jgi:hypothetical protein
VFRGQYLPLSLSKRGVPYIQKQKERKMQVQNKKEPHKIKKKSEVRLSDFTKPANLSDFTRAENWSDLACPFVPLELVRVYQGCELVRFYQGQKLVRSCLSVLPDFTKAANLSVFTSAENWSDLAYPFCLILPRLITCQFLPGL